MCAVAGWAQATYGSVTESYLGGSQFLSATLIAASQQDLLRMCQQGRKVMFDSRVLAALFKPVPWSQALFAKDCRDVTLEEHRTLPTYMYVYM